MGSRSGLSVRDLNFGSLGFKGSKAQGSIVTFT